MILNCPRDKKAEVNVYESSNNIKVVCTPRKGSKETLSCVGRCRLEKDLIIESGANMTVVGAKYCSDTPAFYLIVGAEVGGVLRHYCLPLNYPIEGSFDRKVDCRSCNYKQVF